MKSYRLYLRRVLARLTLGTLITLAVPLFVALLVLRFYGLPDAAKNYLLAEIEKRHIVPFPIAVDNLLLDPTGAILANRVTVFRDANRQSVMLQVDRVRVSVAWLSWWRGRGFIDSASISNADVSYPLGAETADFHEVNADVAFDGKMIKIENAQARFLQFALSVRGTIHNDGFPKAKPPTKEQLAARENLWGTIEKAADDVGTEQPIDVQLEFETSTRDLGAGRANFALDGRHLTWRSAPVDELSIRGSLNDGVAEMSRLQDRPRARRIDGLRRMESRRPHRCALQFTSSMDFTTLAPAFPGALGQMLTRLDFGDSVPLTTGHVLLDLQQGFHADVQADVDWRNFTFNGKAFQLLRIPIAYDGKRLLIPGLKLVSAAGNVDSEFFFERHEEDPRARWQGHHDARSDHPQGRVRGRPRQIPGQLFVRGRRAQDRGDRDRQRSEN